MNHARVTIRIASDGLSALASVIPGERAARAELDAALAAAGVVFGVDIEACERLAAGLEDARFALRDVALAAGLPASPGVDGAFLPAFHVGVQPGHVRDDGSMDFYDRELLKPVGQGELVGHIRTAVRGAAGTGVDGRQIPIPEVGESRLQFGAGIEPRSDGSVVARRAGVLLYTPEQSLDVVDQYIHAANVDLRSGHLSMEGSLVVKGDVQRMFNVRASGDVEIHGSVESGSVHAGGNVGIRGRVQGGGAGMVYAEGNLSAHHAERATLACGGQLSLEQALHCELSAKTIRIAQGLRGGTARAEQSIIVEDAGSPQGSSDTWLMAGVVLEAPLTDALRAQSAARQQRTQERLAGGAVRGDGERVKGGKTGRASAVLQRAELEHKLARRAHAERLLPLARIEIAGTAHPGLRVQIGAVQLVLEHAMRSVAFSFDMEHRLIHTQGPPG